MTKQTPEQLRARVSNLSLRLSAHEAESESRSPFSSAAQTESRNPASSQLREPRLSNKSEPGDYTKPFCDFLTENPTIFHTVDHFKRKLADAGFQELPARDSWAGKLRPGGKYWTTRNGSALIAFKVGAAYEPGNGVAMVAGHVDALTAKLKPVSAKRNAAGYVQLGVAPYAGALNQTWWDRDLSIGGRVVVRETSSSSSSCGGGTAKAKTSTRLVKLGWPIARIPTLAPHFGVGMTGQNNPETQAVPIIGLDNSDLFSGSQFANADGGDDDDEERKKTQEKPLGPPGSFVNTQPPKLVKLIASELGLASDPSSILDWELELFDSQPAQTGGMDRELIFAPRIDDKLCSWAALHGLLSTDDQASDGGIKLVALFDDEEIGSLLRQGARGNFLPSTIERAVESLTNAASSSSSASSSPSYGPGVIGRTYASSFLLSADVTHAGNPNFLAYYLADHVPRLNVGLVLCADSNGHLTTDAVSTAILRRVAERSGCRTQIFQIRNDTRSGGTVGPMLSSAMGVRAADAGLPQLSMHSIRATTGSLDPGLGVKFFRGFLDHFEEVDAEWQH